ncbi:UNVERIFIED_CONTAM: hypothetical protein HDU68_012247 [Siphonaria sp. JEL0065]|nr:hypothetical protein HDU68_012247 [Siphonaria sp. JEL0065]
MKPNEFPVDSSRNASSFKKELIRRIIPQQTEDMTVRWARTTLWTILTLSIFSIALEVWIIIQEIQAYTSFDGIDEEAINTDDMSQNNGNFVIGVTYHIVYIGSILFFLLITWNGIMHQNSLQTMSINALNIALWVYSITQIIQTKNDLGLFFGDAPFDFKPFLFAQLPLAIIWGLFIPVYAFLSIRLRQEFAWRMYRITGGNKETKALFTCYHILLLLNKFAFCFVVGFTLLHLVLTPVSLAGLISIPIAVGVVGVAVTIAGFYAVRQEWRALMLVYQIGCLSALTFLIERMYHSLSRGNSDLKRIEIPFIMYASISLTLSLSSFVCGILCWMNFGKGLKEALMQEVEVRGGKREVAEIDLDA